MKRTLTIIALAGLASAASAGTITTMFASDNGFAGNMFDANIVSADDLIVSGFDLNWGVAGEILQVDVYIRAGGWTGFGNDPSAWTLMSSTMSDAAAGLDLATHVDVDAFTLMAGTNYGIYIDVANYNDLAGSLRYTNGDGSNQFFANADVELSLGAGLGPSFDGNVFVPRVWNGTMYYDAVPTPASMALIGLGGLVATRRRR